MTELIQVTLEEAKEQLSQLAERAWLGDSVQITRNGKPYLDLRPHVGPGTVRKPGRLKGKIQVSAGFDNTPKDIIDGFHR